MLRIARSISAGRRGGVAHGQGQSRFGFDFFDHFAQLTERDVLDLAHALASHAEFYADVFEGLFSAAIEAEARVQNGWLRGCRGF